MDNSEQEASRQAVKPSFKFLLFPILSIAIFSLLFYGLFVAVSINSSIDKKDKQEVAAETTSSLSTGEMATDLVKRSADAIVARDSLAGIERTIDTHETPFSGIPYTCIAVFQAAKKFETTDPERAQSYRAYGARIADFLVTYKDMDKDGKFGWGLGSSWDAFGNGTINPKHTEYAFQTPMSLLCLADAYEVSRKADYLSTASWAINHYGSYGTSSVNSLCSNCYYYWYSHSAYDKGRFVKNTNVLMGLAVTRWAKIRNNSVYLSRANQIYNSEKYEIDTKKNFAYLGRSDPSYALRRDSHIWTEIWFSDEVASILGKTDNKNMLTALRNDFWKCGATCKAETTSSYGMFSACAIAHYDTDSRAKCEQIIRDNSADTQIVSEFPLIGIIKSLDVLNSNKTVTWESIAKASTEGDVLSKTGTTIAWDSGAKSMEILPAGNGYVEMTITDATSKNRFLGLNHNNSTVSYTDIDYAFRFSPVNNGEARIYENGSNKNIKTTQTVGDVFRIAIEAGKAKYYKNNTLIYTSAQAPVYPFFVDVSLYQSGSQIPNVKFVSN